MPRTRPTLAPLLLLAFAACRTPGAVPGPATPTSTPEALVSSLQVEAVRADSVRLVLQVTNAAETPLEVTFSSGQTYDFAVSEAGGTLWSWSADKTFLQALRSETLAPGETRSYAEVWRPGAGLSGRPLQAVGRLVSSDHPVEVTAAFVVP